jgi:SSS family solute:Na+ symporter/sodium/proline symporter
MGSTPYFIAILVYLGSLIVVGAFLTRRVKTGSDFTVAGRKLPLVVMVGTLVATWIGTGSIMGNAGLAWRNGFSALWSPLGGVLGIAVVFFLAARARRFAGVTVPEILEVRYHPAARALAAVVTVIAYTVITSYQFRAGGRVLNLVTDLSVDQGIVLTAVFVIAYTALAGMLSVAYTDLINGVIMTVGLVIVLPMIVIQAGGWGAIEATGGSELFDTFNGEVQPLSAWNFMLPSMLLLMGESNMFGRFFSAKSSGVAKHAVIGWIVGVALLETVVIAIGVAGRGMFPNIAELYPDVANASEVVIPHMIISSVHPALGVVLVAALAAVIVSTADSFLLTPATNIVNDIWKRFFQPTLDGSREIIVLRSVVVGLGVWAFIQVQFFPNILAAALYAYTMYGAAITPAVLAAFFWKRASVAGGVASIATGMTVTLLWQWFIQPRLDPGGVGMFDAVIPAGISSVAVLVLVSFATPAPAREKWEPFYKGQS